MKKKIEYGVLVYYSGIIICLKFYGNRYLISGVEDGFICIWDVKKWECLKLIKVYKGQVIFFFIYLFGKLVLLVGIDKILRMWNFVEGRLVFIKNIK